MLVTVLAMRGGLTLAVVVLVASLALGRWSKEELNRKSFPQGFIFGTASSAYQNEGAGVQQQKVGEAQASRTPLLTITQAASPWLYIYPQGIQEFLVYFKETYKSPIIYLTENGVNEYDNKTSTLEEALRDDVRIDFYREHLAWLHKAIREGVDVRGYFAWTLLDNFEWADGYTVRFGMYYGDFENGSKRYPKHSAHWFKKFLKG